MIDYNKKIVSYLDGSLSIDERSEFEAYVHTHPEFELKVREKEQEIQLLKGLVPAVTLTAEAAETLDREIKQSIFNLLKEEPKNLWERIGDKVEELLTR